jgi:Ca-activated chloride channel family protein
MAEETLTTGFAVAWPWLLLLAPVPWLLRLLMPASPSGDLQALRVPWFSAVTGGKAGWMRRPLLALIFPAVWIHRT